jgi:hypothetical protein
MPPADAAFNMFKPTFVRTIGALPTRPALARFEVADGVRVMLRDQARVEVVVWVRAADRAAGGALRTAAAAVDVEGSPSEAHGPWIEAVCEAVRGLDPNPAWAAFLAGLPRGA